mgnify:FL=1
MPSIYAHTRFGRDLFDMLPEPAKHCVSKYRELYDIGLQGPDILFFYHPIRNNYVNQLGYSIHDWQGRKFFQAAARTIRARRTKEASLAYMCGVLCHYALDLVCHPYIERMVHSSRLHHCAIEGAFERLLIVEDHLPLNTLVTSSIHISKENASVIRQFYGHTTGKQILSALRFMVLCNDGLRLKDTLFKKSIFLFLRLIGKYDSIAGMVISPEPQPEYDETNKKLRQLYEEAKPVAIDLIQEFFSSISTGKALGHHFFPTFSG